MLLSRGCVLVLLLLAATVAHAAPEALVEGIQLPAWFTRDGTRQTLDIGTELKNGDEVVTGAGSRLLLRLADGSTVNWAKTAGCNSWP